MPKGRSKGFGWQQSMQDRERSLSKMKKNIDVISKQTAARKEEEKKRAKEDNQIKATLSSFRPLNSAPKLNHANSQKVLDEGIERDIDQSYCSITSLLLEAKENIGIYFLLSWPSSAEWLIFSQFLANQELLLKNTHRSGYKLAVYPARPSIIGRLKKKRIDRNKLIQIAQDAVNSGAPTDSRMMAYLSLHEFSKLDHPNEREHPSIKDLTPCFCLDDKGNWDSIGEGYMGDIYTYMFNASGNKRRSTISKISEILQNPHETSEGVFLVPPNIQSKNLNRLLQLDKKLDAIAVDAREKNIQTGNLTIQDISKILDSWFHTEKKSSLIFILDSPSLFKACRRNVFTSYKKTNIKLGQNDWCKQYALLRLADQPLAAFANNSIPEQLSTSSLKPPNIKIVGLGQIAIFEVITQIISEAEHFEPSLAKEMRKALGFLHRITSFPISQNKILAWIRDISADWPEDHVISLSRKYHWNSFFRGWSERVSGYGAINSIRKFQDECQKIANLIQDETEIESIINTIARGVSEGELDNVLILSTERKAVEFIQELVSQNFQNDISENIDILRASDHFEISKYNQVFVFGLSRHCLKDILLKYSSSLIPIDIYISAYSALFVNYELNILNEIEAFNELSDWIKGLNTQITTLVTTTSVLDSLPTIASYTDDRISESHDSDHDHESFATIHLGNYGPLEVAQHSTLLIFDRQSETGWKASTVECLEESDRVVVIDSMFMSEADKIIGNLTHSNEEEEQILRSYFTLAQNFIKEKYTQTNRKTRARSIHKKMAELDEEKSSEITINMVERWLKNIEDYSVEIQEVSSQSARREDHYLLFAKAVSLDGSIASMFWKKGIRRFRSKNVQEGRKHANHIRHLLAGTFDHRLLGISESEFEEIKLLAKAREYPVEMITYIE
jgi:hypothetical protein